MEGMNQSLYTDIEKNEVNMFLSKEGRNGEKKRYKYGKGIIFCREVFTLF